MDKNRIFYFLSILVILAAVATIVFHLKFWIIPPVFFGVGLLTWIWNRRSSVAVFCFLLPFINASSSLTNPSYAFNYIAPSLFLLCGMAIVPLLKGLWKPGQSELTGDWWGGTFTLYRLFQLFLLVSALVVWFRWSNMTIDSHAALGANTPVSPGTRAQRVSFASVFPVVSLFLYFIAPYIYGMVKKLKPTAAECFRWVSYGFIVSVGMAVFQKLSGQSLVSDRLGKELKQFYGGFSDFNAFGFFSGVMFLWASYEIKGKNRLGYVVFLISMLGGILSGSRTFFFFILAGMVNLFLNREPATRKKTDGKRQKLVLGTLVAVVLIIVIFMGGTLKERLNEGLANGETVLEKINAITNGRLWMTAFSFETVRDHLIPGIGTGNFTFYLDYKNVGEHYLYDLSLNQYTLVFAENGLFGFLCFTAFLLLAARNSSRKLLMGTILASLLLNNFFWFPEAFLLFWILAAVFDTGQAKQPELAGKGLFKRYSPLIIGGVVLIFLVFNLVHFNRLHPKTWAQETGTRYDYGFWYPEKNEKGTDFQWTREMAGVWMTLDKNGESPDLKISCGAPLAHLPQKKQTVVIYWKGNVYKTFVFTENKEVSFRIKAPPMEEGLLEVRTMPVFNLRDMGLGPETRTLGVQLRIQKKRG